MLKDELPDFQVEEEASEAEPWLVSYADLMTLLFGFFAMLFTYASFEDTGTVRMGKNMARYFGGNYIAPSETVSKEMKFLLGKSPYTNDMELKAVEDGLEVSFITSIIFENGRTELLPKALKPLDVLIMMIKSTEKDSKIRIEGHTDDSPVSSSVFPSNWELSAARAASIARYFEKSGFPNDRIAISGYGSSRPAFPNRDEDGKPIPTNQAHNRRVVIKVILPKGKQKNTDMDPEIQKRKIISN